MRNKLLFGLLAFVAVFVLFAFADGASENKEQYLLAPATYAPTVFDDTLTSGQSDTTTLTNFVSLYNIASQVTMTQQSGTTNVATYVDASLYTSGTTNWVRIDTLSGTGAGNRIFDHGTTVYVRYRFIDKATGTQSTRIQRRVNGKLGVGLTAWRQ